MTESTETPVPLVLGGPVAAWIDGSCRPNPGRGGWAVILRNAAGGYRELSGAEAHTTNNRMELTGAVAALEALKRPCRITIHTDSGYLSLGMQGRLAEWQAAGWRTTAGKPVKNADLWQRLNLAAAPHEVTWQWIKGHAGDPMNARADAIAGKARERVR